MGEGEGVGLREHDERPASSTSPLGVVSLAAAAANRCGEIHSRLPNVICYCSCAAGKTGGVADGVLLLLLGERERAHLVVQLGRAVCIYVFMYLSGTSARYR